VACQGGGLDFFDISDPTGLLLVNNYDPDGGVSAVACRDGFAFTAAYAEGMRIVDIRDPSLPLEAALCPVGGGGSGIFVRENIAFVAAGYCGLRTFDVSEPTAPAPLGHCPVEDNLKDVAVWGDYAFTATGLGVKIFDVSDPAFPAPVGGHAIEGGAQDIAARGDFVLFTNFHKGLVVLDVSNPASPLLFGKLPVDPAHQVALGEKYAYVTVQGETAADGGLLVVDYTTPGIPEMVGRLAMRKAVDLALGDGVAFVGGTTPDYEFGLIPVDISDPTDPVALGFLEVAWPLSAFAAGQGYLYLSEVFQDTLRVIDVSDPTAPFQAGYFTRPGYHTLCIHPTDGLVFTNGIWIFRNDLLTGVGPVPLAGALDLRQNWPNPFNPSTTIRYRLTVPATVRLSIYDLAGRLVRQLKDGIPEGPGTHRATWHGRDSCDREVASGTYLYRLEAGRQQATRSMVLIR